MRKQTPKQPSLFDFDDEPAPVTAGLQVETIDLPRSEWREVPQALFDSWPVGRQLAYCRDRDMDGALYAPTDEEALWFKARADWYSQELSTLRSRTS
jgi:hypothetical protein